MPWITIAWTFVASFASIILNQVESARLGDIYWNSTSPIFRIDNTDHIIDVNKGTIPFEYDQVNIFCPVYNEDTHVGELEKYIIYNVSKEEYDSCRISNPSPRIIAICDKPHQLRYFTITFRSFTPQPGGLEFKPGQDYYFITTSGANSLSQKVGGKCATHNMKVIFKVCCSLPRTTIASTSSSTTTIIIPSLSTLVPVHSHRHKPSTQIPFHHPASIITNKYSPPPVKSFEYPKQEDWGKTKKIDSRTKLPNETREKNEEWVNSAKATHQNILHVIGLLVVYHLFKIRS